MARVTGNHQGGLVGLPIGVADHEIIEGHPRIEPSIIEKRGLIFVFFAFLGAFLAAKLGEFDAIIGAGDLGQSLNDQIFIFGIEDLDG